MRKLLWDISGAFGDIGVLFPLAVVLIAKNGLNPTALFLMAGLLYAASAWYFRITMPVQPLKAMFAIAVAMGLGPAVIHAAGVVMGLILVAIAVTGISVRLGELFPVSVIRGIQLGLGAMLVRSSFNLIGPDIAIAGAAGVVLLVTIMLLKNVPPLIPILALGAALSWQGASMLEIGPVALAPAIPGLTDLWNGFVILVLPQIALTFGNAIVATRATGRSLYGPRAERLTLKSIPLSMGIANVVSGILGGAPMCHGSGGLTAHFKFGATDHRSGYLMGAVLVVIALLFGGSAVAVISAFPAGILSVLLCYVGIQHALFIRDILGNRSAVLIAVTVGITGFALGNLTFGFLAGLALHHGSRVLDRGIAAQERRKHVQCP